MSSRLDIEKMDYRANLDGLRVDDKLKCSNGDVIIINSITHKHIATGQIKQGRSVIVLHSEANNNCWFYNKKNN